MKKNNPLINNKIFENNHHERCSSGDIGQAELRVRQRDNHRQDISPTNLHIPGGISDPTPGGGGGIQLITSTVTPPRSYRIVNL